MAASHHLDERQQRILTFVARGQGHAVVEAVAGSGKSTTLKAAIGDKKALVVAFNKSVAEDYEKILPKTARVATLHSIGLEMLQASKNTTYQLDEFKKDTLVQRLIFNEPGGQNRPVQSRRAALKWLLERVQNTLLDWTNRAALQAELEQYETTLEPDLQEDVLDKLPVLVGRALNSADHYGKIDFDEMIWLPDVWQCGPPSEQYEWLFVDEAQDLNPAQLKLIEKLLTRCARALIVGDSAQSIYGFRGAVDGMGELRKLLRATRLPVKELPLSCCYRCPSTHVELAAHYVPTIVARIDAPPGIIRDRVPLADALKAAQEGDLILCRRNMPIVRVAYDLVKQHHKPARIAGEPLLESELRHFVESCADLAAIHTLAAQEKKRKVAHLAKNNRRHQIPAVEEFYACVVYMAEQEGSRDNLLKRINEIFVKVANDPERYIFCSTIHRAKGSTTNRTWVLRVAEEDKDPDSTQARNLNYVAVTRAKQELVFVDGPAYPAKFKEASDQPGEMKAKKRAVAEPETSKPPAEPGKKAKVSSPQRRHAEGAAPATHKPSEAAPKATIAPAVRKASEPAKGKQEKGAEKERSRATKETR